MPITIVNIIKGDKTSTETDYRDALPVNMYGVIRDILGAQGYMLSYPGLTHLGTGRGIDRGGNFNDRFKKHFRVSGEKLIEVGTSGAVTELGSIPGGSQAAMPYSFNTQAVIADGRMYLYGPDSGFSEVTDPDLGRPSDGVWIDHYYLLTDGEHIYHTDIDDESSIGLKFATAEFMPDPSLGVAKTQDNKAIVFGRYSIEFFANVATDNFAFQRLPERAQKIGIVATHAKCELGGSFYFCGGRKKEALGVYALGVGNSPKISTREIDKILSTYTEPELVDIRMESRVQDDVGFLIVHLPNETLCFNANIAKKFGLSFAWSILKSDIDGDTPYRGINGVFEANIGKMVYGDKYSTQIGYLDNTVSTQYGEIIEWLLFTPLVNLKYQSISNLYLETIPGHTVTDDATVAVSLTYDGLTYGKEWFVLYGSPLEYGKNFEVNRLSGFIRDNVGLKFRGASSSRMAFSGARLTHG